jgi:hypothetical protein
MEARRLRHQCEGGEKMRRQEGGECYAVQSDVHRVLRGLVWICRSCGSNAGEWTGGVGGIVSPEGARAARHAALVLDELLRQSRQGPSSLRTEEKIGSRGRQTGFRSRVIGTRSRFYIWSHFLRKTGGHFS